MAAIACLYGAACVAIDVFDRKLSQRLGNCWLVRRGGRDDRAVSFSRGGAGHELPGPWRSLLLDGQVWTALILSTSYSEKYKGRFMRPGAAAAVHLPACGAQPRRTWSPRLLHRAGCPEAAAFVWLGDETAGDRTVYVAFSMMRRFGQAKRILFSKLQPGGTSPGSSSPGASLSSGWPDSSPQEVADQEEAKDGSCGPETGAEEEMPEEPCWETLRVASYVRQKIDALWEQHGFAEELARIAAAFSGHQIIFAGMSHGAALAQAAALRFNLGRPPSQALAVTWNAYKWTDAAGSRIAGHVMGDSLLPLVLTRWIPGRGGKPGYRCWDSIAGCPAGFEPMPQIRLLDVDTGSFLPCESLQDCPGRSRIGAWDSFKRLWRLHYAAMAIVATRAAMQAAALHA